MIIRLTISNNLILLSNNIKTQLILKEQEQDRDNVSIIWSRHLRALNEYSHLLNYSYDQLDYNFQY